MKTQMSTCALYRAKILRVLGLVYLPLIFVFSLSCSSYDLIQLYSSVE